MDFLEDYWTYHSRYEIPRNYALWSGLTLISATVHRRVLFYHGDLEFTGMIYTGLIGAPGNSKSTCNDFARSFFEKANPGAKIGPSRASPEKIVQLMAADDFGSYFVNHLNEKVQVRPYAFFINEFQNFLGRSPFDMIALVTDIYDRKAYDGSTLARGVEFINNPAVTILMCAPPDWFIDNIKGTLISGGVARRFVMVYESYGSEAKPDIIKTPESVTIEDRLVRRLTAARSLAGEFKWGNGHDPYVAWYHDNFKRRSEERNTVMQGYLKSKNVHLYKIMMLLDVVSDKPMFVFTKDLFDMALALLDVVEKNMPKLSAAAGRNEMMGPQQKLLDLLEASGGWMPEKKLKREIEAELAPDEIFRVLRHLEDSEQIVRKPYAMPNGEGVKIKRDMVWLPWKYVAMEESGEIIVVKKPTP